MKNAELVRRLNIWSADHDIVVRTKDGAELRISGMFFEDDDENTPRLVIETEAERGTAIVRLTADDVLDEFGLTPEETEDTALAAKNRKIEAAKFLEHHRGVVTDAARKAGRIMIGFVGDGPQSFKLL